MIQRYLRVNMAFSFPNNYIKVDITQLPKVLATQAIYHEINSEVGNEEEPTNVLSNDSRLRRFAIVL